MLRLQVKFLNRSISKSKIICEINLFLYPGDTVELVLTKFDTTDGLFLRFLLDIAKIKIDIQNKPGKVKHN